MVARVVGVEAEEHWEPAPEKDLRQFSGLQWSGVLSHWKSC